MNKKKLKDRISAHRFVSAYYCGKHGSELMKNDEENKFITKAMQRGNAIDYHIRSSYESGDSLKAWEELLPSRDEIDLSPNMTSLLSKSIKAVPLPFVGIVDLITKKKKVYELKTGVIEEWHLLQGDFYRWLVDSEEPAVVVWLDHNKSQECPKVVTDEFVESVWNKLIKAEPTINVKCKVCPAASECEARVKPSNFIVENLLHKKSEYAIALEGYEKEKEKLQIIAEATLKPFKEKLELASSEFLALKETAEKQLENFIYKTKEGARVTVYYRKVESLPDNYLELRPYEKYPHLYKAPEPKRRDLLTEIGIEGQEKTLRIDLGNPERK